MTIILNPDTPFPGCAVVDDGQRLRIVNSMIAVLNGRARDARISARGIPTVTIRTGEALVLERPIGTYFALGQHFVRYLAGEDTAFDLWVR